MESLKEILVVADQLIPIISAQGIYKVLDGADGEHFDI